MNTLRLILLGVLVISSGVKFLSDIGFWQELRDDDHGDD